jgi:hypothetical protein
VELPRSREMLPGVARISPVTHVTEVTGMGAYSCEEGNETMTRIGSETRVGRPSSEVATTKVREGCGVIFH